MVRFNIGDIVIFRHPRHGPVARMTEGREYQVVEYDPNTAGWPAGCCGTPFITVVADDGQPFSAYAYRFVKINLEN